MKLNTTQAKILFSLVFIIILSGCKKRSEKAQTVKETKISKETEKVFTSKNALRKVGAQAIQDNGSAKSLEKSIENSLKYLRRTRKKTFRFGPRTVTRKKMVESLEDIKKQLQAKGLTSAFFTYIQKNFHFYQSSAPGVLFTGYYEAQLTGSLKPSKTYAYPLYRKPKDLVRLNLRSFPFYKKDAKLPRRARGRLTANGQVLPYYTRDEIDYQGKLKGQGLEIVWIDNPIDVFFLHIQGSGVVTLPNGKIMRVNYADQNGHPYYAIGKTLLKEGILTKKTISMQSIRKYLQKHPNRWRDILSQNPSYVFFRKVKNGPLGNLGVPVTGFRSIATDYRLFPKGSLCFIKTRLPVFDASGKIASWTSYPRLVLNQDTGGAIRGPGRVDLFTGFGKKSERIAGHLKEKGELYFLIKK